MKPDQLYSKFRAWNERLSADIRSFGAMNGAKNTIKMRDYKGHLYIFQYEVLKHTQIHFDQLLPLL